jgi:hypothetical protein
MTRGRISRLQRYTNKNNQENFVIEIPIKNPLTNRKIKHKAKIIMQSQRKIMDLRYTVKIKKGNKMIPVSMLKIRIFNMYSLEVWRVLKINETNRITPIFRIQKQNTKKLISAKSGKPWSIFPGSFTSMI